jgi:hypothetical protein
MTAVADAKVVMETLAGKPLTVDKRTEITEAFVALWADQRRGRFAPDVSALTNEEKSQIFMDEMKLHGVRTTQRHRKALKDAEFAPQYTAAIEAGEDAWDE